MVNTGYFWTAQMRSVPEWQGSSPDAEIPPWVRLRVFEKFGGCCVACHRKIVAGDWQCDHDQALANGGRNAEDNLQVLCNDCHKYKTSLLYR